jgi:hypothetical protein
MSTITDAFGRTVTISTDSDGSDVYALPGLSVSFPAGTAEAVALASINAHAPGVYVAPKVDWSFFEFMDLFSTSEQTAIMNSTDPRVRLFCLMASGAGALQLTNSDVISGVNYLAISGAIASARVAAILAGQAPS